jgi:SAM-dependent methyltransferase
MNSQLRETFHDQGQLFDFLASGDILYEYDSESLDKLAAIVASPGGVLDIGCGDGVIGAHLAGAPHAGIDISPRCATGARKRGIFAAVADVSEGLPFDDGVFNTVYCIDVLHHVTPHWDALFPEIDRVLRRGGTFVIVEPDATNLFVRLTQAPNSPIRVAPWNDEPAIRPNDMATRVEALGYIYTLQPIHISGAQTQRNVFPLWQRLLKAPFVLALAYWYRNTPNKFCLIATKPPPSAESLSSNS